MIAAEPIGTVARIAAHREDQPRQRERIDLVDLRRVMAIIELDTTGEVAVVLETLDRLDGKPNELEAAEAVGAVTITDGLVRRAERSARVRATSPGQRRAIHRALADVLREPRHRAQRAEHLAAAAIGHDAQAALALAELGEAASLTGATTSAAGCFARAARFEPDPEQRAWYLYRAADSWWNAGEYSAARDAFGAAHAGSAQPVLRADVMLQLGELEMYERGPRYARDMFLQASRAVAGHDVDRAANLLVHAAATALLTADVAGALALAHEADQMAQQGDGVSALASSLMVAFLSLHHGDHAEYDARFPALRSVADVLLDADHPQADLFLQLVGMAHVYTEDWDAGRTYLTAVVHSASRRDRSATAALASATLAELCWRSGRWDEAWTLATSDLVRDVTLTGARLWLLAFTAHLDAGYGRAGDCRERAHRAISESEPMGLGTAAMWARHALGLLDLGLGCPAEAAVHLDHLAAHASAHEAIEPSIIWWQADHIEALIRAGRRREAISALTRFESAAERSDRVWARAAAARCRGIAAASLDEAEGAFGESLAYHERLVAPFELGRTLLCRAERRAISGAALDPTADIEESAAIFEALGAAQWLTRARDVSAQLRRRAAADWAGSLSPAQRRVATAVGDGLANRDIAAQLHISEKTVEFHLHNVFVRLGVTSRTQLMKRMGPHPDDSNTAG